jgi:hypothetical protein
MWNYARLNKPISHPLTIKGLNWLFNLIGFSIGFSSPLGLVVCLILAVLFYKSELLRKIGLAALVGFISIWLVALMSPVINAILRTLQF